MSDCRETRFIAHFEQSIAAKRAAQEACQQSLFQAVDLITACFREGGKIMICGNGGSAADAQHLAAEFVSRLTMDFDRPALPALALTTDTSFITAFVNDIGFEDVFKRQVEALGTSGDVLLGFSTSGNSTNVIRAMQTSRTMGIHTIGFTGQGGQVVSLAEVTLSVPSDVTQYIQETHVVLYHILCDLVERELYGYS